MKKTIALVLLCLLVFLNTLQAKTLPSGIQVILNMEKSQYLSRDALLIHTTFTNTSQKTITFLKWNTALDSGLNADFFHIENAQQESIAYIGKRLKRLAPKKHNYITLKAGESSSNTLDLSKGYALTKKGFYRIHYQSDHGITQSNQLHFTLLNNKPASKHLFKQANFASCSSTQKTTLNNAMPEAVTIANSAISSLENTPSSGRMDAFRYINWFGDYSSTYYSTVIDHFSKIKDALDNQQINFFCDCTDDGVIAYVYPNDPNNIHLCSSFWELEKKGIDSQSGTIIHELSHFTKIADTNDHAYGRSDSLFLAINNPVIALNNADNYEYFAENTPFFSMHAEPDLDDTPQSAKPIPINSAFTDAISPAIDEDWLTFNLEQNSDVVIKTTGPTNGDTVITLYNKNGMEIEENDDNSTTDYYSTIELLNANKGLYFIKVKGFDAIVPEYTLTLTATSTDLIIPIIIQLLLEE